jgi:2-oxoglutarate ferredoxin oxidoreductase subunit beta
MNPEQIKQKLATKNEITWCPGCTNFLILESVKRTIAKLISEGEKQENFAIVTDIGCNSKIFDYINVSGIYGLHGRAVPTAEGIKLGNPNLNVIAFSGDGGIYSEGIEHFVHAGRFNADLTLVVMDNQSFSLTTGQATPTTQQGYKNKAEPLGEFNPPLNPIKLALASGITFIARCNARDMPHMVEILEQAVKHKGFSFVEIIQDCLIFNDEADNKDKFMYKITNKDDIKKALELADEYDYNSKSGKIPIGILFQTQKPTLEDKWPQLKELKNKGIGWKDLKK